MTNNREEISADDQIAWFRSLDTSACVPYLFYSSELGVTFAHEGYALLKSTLGMTVLTGGLVESARNKGLGATLFRQMIQKAKVRFPDQPIHLDVLRANDRAFNLYKKLGFKTLYETREIRHMRYEE